MTAGLVLEEESCAPTFAGAVVELGICGGPVSFFTKEAAEGLAFDTAEGFDTTLVADSGFFVAFNGFGATSGGTIALVTSVLADFVSGTSGFFSDDCTTGFPAPDFEEDDGLGTDTLGGEADLVAEGDLDFKATAAGGAIFEGDTFLLGEVGFVGDEVLTPVATVGLLGEADGTIAFF